MDSEGFQLVRKKKASRARKLHLVQDTACLPQESKDDCLMKIQQAKEVIQGSKGYLSFQERLDRVEEELKTVLAPDLSSKISTIVCYGLGRVSCSRIARYQGALLLILKDHYNASSEIYDPVFSSVDAEVLEDLGIKVLKRNEEGKRKVTGITLFFLPHCGKELYNNLLWANWRASSLPFCVIIGNSFSSIVQNVPTRILRQHYTYIYNAQDMFKELPLESLVEDDDIFNDVNIHIPCSSILHKSPEFWLENREPVYEDCDVEIVRIL